MTDMSDTETTDDGDFIEQLQPDDTLIDRGVADVLDEAIERTVPGGRIAVLSYHSGEDRIVKDRMRSAATGDCPCPPELPCVCDAVQTVRLVRGVPRTPSKSEQLANRRAASARLRVVERIVDSPTRGRR